MHLPRRHLNAIANKIEPATYWTVSLFTAGASEFLPEHAVARSFLILKDFADLLDDSLETLDEETDWPLPRGLASSTAELNKDSVSKALVAVRNFVQAEGDLLKAIEVEGSEQSAEELRAEFLDALPLVESLIPELDAVWEPGWRELWLGISKPADDVRFCPPIASLDASISSHKSESGVYADVDDSGLVTALHRTSNGTVRESIVFRDRPHHVSSLEEATNRSNSSSIRNALTYAHVKDAVDSLMASHAAAQQTGPQLLKCAFCNASQSEVAKLIMGPTVGICNGCTLLSYEILQSEGVVE